MTDNIKVFFTYKIPGPAIDILKSAGLDLIFADKKLNSSELKDVLKNSKADVLVCLLTDEINEEVLSSGIKICATYSVGFNHIDLQAAKKHGVAVLHTPGVLTNAVAEFTISAMLALAKRIKEANEFAVTGKYKGWDPELLLGYELYGKSLGIIGAGRIGTRVAELAKAFSMEVFYNDVKENKYIEDKGAVYLPKDELLARSDFVSLHVPLLESTYHLLSYNEFETIKHGAFLVNTARGPVVDESALVDAIKSGKLAGVALDVFEFEPKIPEAIADLPNVLLTPHIASASKRARNLMSRILADGIIDTLKGKKAKNRVV